MIRLDAFRSAHVRHHAADRTERPLATIQALEWRDPMHLPGHLSVGTVLICLSLTVGHASTRPEDPLEDPLEDEPAAVTPSSLDAGMEAGMYSLANDGASGALVSWLEPSARGRALRFASYDGRTWSEPRTIVEGEDLFSNWADHPSIAALPDGRLVAQWPGHQPWAHAQRLVQQQPADRRLARSRHDLAGGLRRRERQHSLIQRLRLAAARSAWIARGLSHAAAAELQRSHESDHDPGARHGDRLGEGDRPDRPRCRHVQLLSDRIGADERRPDRGLSRS